MKHRVYLDKIVCMISRIRESLPSYKEYLNAFTSKRATTLDTELTLHTEVRYRRVYKGLSYVYADIMQFFSESCRIFDTNSGTVTLPHFDHLRKSGLL